MGVERKTMGSLLQRTGAWWLRNRQGVELNTRPLYPNNKLQPIISEKTAKELHIVMVSYDARSRKLTVGTDPRHRQLVEEKFTGYARDSGFLKQLSNPSPDQIGIVVEVFNTEQVEAALKTLYPQHSSHEIDHLKPTITVARCLNPEIAALFNVMVMDVFGTTVRCLAEDGTGRDALIKLFNDQELKEKIAEVAFGNRDVGTDLVPEIKFVPKGTVERQLGEIYQLDRSAHNQRVENAAVRLNEGTQARTREEQREKGEPEELLSEILGRLAEEKCSDVKISYDFTEGCMVVRARSSGSYKDEGRYGISNEAFKRVIIWVLSRLNTEPVLRKNHDGALTFKGIRLPKSKRTIDLTTRVSYLPLVDTENRDAVCNGRLSFRILSGVSSLLRLDELGYIKVELDQVGKILNHKFGLVLMVGEMGSGKSQTATAILTDKKINNPGQDIVSLEQPVEYHNPYIDQVELGPDENPLNILRSMVRQGINGLFMGEINKKEMAEMAVSAGLGGVFVISTFHAKDAFTAVQRLVGEPFCIPRADLASCLVGVVFQGLATKLCPNCKKRDHNWKDRLKNDDRNRVSGEQLLEMMERLEIPTCWETAYQRFSEQVGETIWNKLEHSQKAALRSRFDQDSKNDLELAVRLAKKSLGEAEMPFQFWKDGMESEGMTPYFIPWIADGKLSKGEDCPECVGKGKKPGTSGRTAIPGIWVPSKYEKKLIVNGESDIALREAALGNHHCTVHRAGIERLHQGVISMEEYFAALGPLNLEDEFPDEIKVSGEQFPKGTPNNAFSGVEDGMNTEKEGSAKQDGSFIDI